MKLNGNEIGKRTVKSALLFVGLALALTFSSQIAFAQTPPGDQKPAEPKPSAQIYQSFYITNLTQQNEFNDLQTDMRNMLLRAKIYGVWSQAAISVFGSAEDLQLAQKMISDLDRPRKIYRLTYTITDFDGGKRIGSHNLAMVVALGQRTVLKQGSRVPVITGTYDAGASTQNSQVQYIDVGMSIEASLDGNPDGLRLHTKVEQSNLAEEKSGVGVQDPVIRQTVLDATSTLAQGKPVVLGSLDVPDSTRKLVIEVVSEAVK